MIQVENDGKQVNYKARLVVKGFQEKKEVDFDEIFSPVVNMAQFELLLDWLPVLI